MITQCSVLSMYTACAVKDWTRFTCYWWELWQVTNFKFRHASFEEQPCFCSRETNVNPQKVRFRGKIKYRMSVSNTIFWDAGQVREVNFMRHMLQCQQFLVCHVSSSRLASLLTQCCPLSARLVRICMGQCIRKCDLGLYFVTIHFIFCSFCL